MLKKTPMSGFFVYPDFHPWNPPNRKKRIEKAIGKIDKKLLNSYEEETVVNETRAIENIVKS